MEIEKAIATDGEMTIGTLEEIKIAINYMVAEEEIKMSDRGVGVIEKAVAALVAETGVVPLTVPVAAALVTVVEDEIIVVVEVTAEIEDRQNKALEKLTMGRAVLFRQHKLHRHQYRNFLLQRRLI